MIGAEYIIKFIQKQKIDIVFGLPGKAIMPTWQAALRGPIHLVLSRHESGGAFMADGWARVRRQPGVVLTTMGPGLTNVITGVATSYADSVPLIVITGQTETQNLGKGTFQDSSRLGRGISANDLFQPITKMSLEPRTPAELLNALPQVYKIATRGRPGPVHLSIPLDVQLGKMPSSSIMNINTQEDFPIVKKSWGEITNYAKRPLLLIGWGSYLSNAGEAIDAFSKAMKIPFISTLKGRAVLADNHPNNIGHIGPGSKEKTDRWIKIYNPDCVVCLGSSLNLTTLDPLKQCAPKASIVKIDIESDSGTTADRILTADVRLQMDFWSNDLITNKLSKNEMPWFKIVKNISTRASVDPKTWSVKIIKTINQVLPKAVIYPDTGNTWLLSLRYSQTTLPGSYFTGIGIGSMGQVIAGVIGHTLANPKRTHLCIGGDGGMLMYGNEISVAVKERLPIIYVVMNNGVLGRIERAQREEWGGPVGSVEIPRVNFAQWAKSLGANGFEIHSLSQFRKILRSSAKSHGPIVCDVKFSRKDPIPL